MYFVAPGEVYRLMKNDEYGFEFVRPCWYREPPRFKAVLCRSDLLAGSKRLLEAAYAKRIEIEGGGQHTPWRQL